MPVPDRASFSELFYLRQRRVNTKFSLLQAEYLRLWAETPQTIQINSRLNAKPYTKEDKPRGCCSHRWGCSSRRPTSRSCWGEFHSPQFQSCQSHSWLQLLLWDNQLCPLPSSQQHTRGNLQQRENETWIWSIPGCSYSTKSYSSWWLNDLGVIGLREIELHERTGCWEDNFKRRG